ncbi:MAG: DNA polymerase III subunit beta [Planctomycetota bacterium]|nr:MAG: DNA polymerase III subunit beta [Planctomycetota bacterium]
MKAVCDRAALLDAITLASGAVAQRSPRPQLQCVHLAATRDGDAGALTLVGADGEVALSLSTLNVDVQAPGECLVPADKLRQIVAAEDAEPTLTLAADGDALTITGADARFNVFGYPAGDFPAPPAFPTDAGATLGVRSDDLARLINTCVFATARENSRYAINGVLVVAEQKTVQMVATDGRRLALARGAALTGPAEPARCIIPTKALNQTLKLINDPDEPVRLAITENQAVLAFGHPEEAPRAVLASNLVEGAFPPYEDVIPRDQDKKAVFDTARLISAVRRAAILTNEDSRGVRLALTPDGDAPTMAITSRAAEMGEAEITVPVESYTGDAIEIGFNPQFIIDALKVVDEAQVTLELKAPNKPGLIRTGPEFTYIVMPVNLQ